MGLYGVRVNGRMAFSMTAGTAGAPSIAFTSNKGIYYDGTGVAVTQAGTQAVGFTNAAMALANGFPLAWSATAPGSADLFATREAANTLKLFDGSTNASTVLLGAVDFRQVASTFAQAATILNGPRAANPVAWVEVRVSGTTGRIPVW